MEIINAQGVKNMKNELKNYIDWEMVCMKSMDYFWNGFVIIKYTKETESLKSFRALGYPCKYDVIRFDNWGCEKIFLDGGLSYDYLDNSARLHRESEKIVYAYHMDKIIIL